MIPAWAWKLPFDLIAAKAKDANLSPALVGAFCMQESGGRSFAPRYEPGFHDLWQAADWAKNLGITQATEETMQRTSWGMAQIMGGTARWHGFKGFLPELAQPDVGLEWACKHIAGLTKAFTKVEDVISVYQWGHLAVGDDGKYPNQAYVDRVLNYFHELQSA